MEPSEPRQPPQDEPLAQPIERCVTTIFPTPIAMHNWPDSDALNAELTALVLAEEARSHGLARSNVGGWHSDMAFIRRPDPALRRLMSRINRMTREMTRLMMRPARHQVTVEGWANVLRHGQYNSLHLHPNSTWSGVYYVTGNPPPEPGTPGTDFSGKFEFVDPRPGASASYTVENKMQQRCLLNPGPGAMLLFPSFVQHLVHPYFGPGERISIAFNVLITNVES